MSSKATPHINPKALVKGRCIVRDGAWQCWRKKRKGSRFCWQHDHLDVKI